MRTYSRFSRPLYSRLVVNFGCLLLVLLYSDLSLAEADGPDYWQVHGVAKDDVLNIRSHFGFKAPKVGEIPYDAQCVKNMGCQGGLTFHEFTTLSESEKQQILKQRPRWCRVSYRGTTGWVAGRYLREGACFENTAGKAAADHDIDMLNHTYIIENEKVALYNGRSREVLPGTTALIVTEMIRRPVYADLTGDGKKEAVSVVTQHTGGSGTFYYLVAAGSGQLIESAFLGDRINIVSLEIFKDVVRVNYLDRSAVQAMSVRPSIRKSADFGLVDNAFVLQGNR